MNVLFNNEKRPPSLQGILAALRSSFSLTANERLVIMLVLALFLFGLALRWRHLSREHADPAATEQVKNHHLIPSLIGNPEKTNTGFPLSRE